MVGQNAEYSTFFDLFLLAIFGGLVEGRVQDEDILEAAGEKPETV